VATSTIGTSEDVVTILRAHVTELRAAGIRHLSLFGSTARDEAGADSDIDLLADLDPDAHIGLIRLAGIELRLGEILGRKVDLLTEPIHKDRLRANIERDRRRVF
jgi:predicted nucleotidyltransferase